MYVVTILRSDIIFLDFYKKYKNNLLDHLGQLNAELFLWLIYTYEIQFLK